MIKLAGLKMMIFNKIRSYLFVSYALVSLALLIIFMYLFRPYNPLLRKGWSRLAFWMLGIKLSIKGEKDPEAQLFILNHQSQFDIVAFEIANSDDLCWVGKQELFKIPFYGHIMKAPKMLGIKREDKRGIIALLSDVAERLTHNRPIVIFPEGTRSKRGELLPFKQGAKIIGDKFGLKVQPVPIKGSGDVLPSGSVTVTSGTIELIYLPSFSADSKNPWLEETRSTMQSYLDTTVKPKA